MIDAIVERSNYPALEQGVYLNQAALGLIGQPAVEAMSDFLEGIARHGNIRMSDRDEVGFFEEVRTEGANLFNYDPDRVAILAGASELLSQMPLMVRPEPGSRVVLVETDFPAVTRPWLRAAETTGHSIRFVRDEPGSDLTDELVGCIDKSTSAVAVGSVQFATGTRIDVARLSAACAETASVLVVDATQEAGALSVDCGRWNADAVVTSGYKWLGAHGGVALAALGPRFLREIPPLTGWMGAMDPFDFDATRLTAAAGARRFTQSTMSYVSMVGLEASLRELGRLGFDAIERHATRLSKLLIERVGPLGWSSFREPTDHSASPHIVSLSSRNHGAEDVQTALRERGIFCGSRRGRLRISLAPYNNERDIESVVAALESLK